VLTVPFEIDWFRSTYCNQFLTLKRQRRRVLLEASKFCLVSRSGEICAALLIWQRTDNNESTCEKIDWGSTYSSTGQRKGWGFLAFGFLIRRHCREESPMRKLAGQGMNLRRCHTRKGEHTQLCFLICVVVFGLNSDLRKVSHGWKQRKLGEGCLW